MSKAKNIINKMNEQYDEDFLETLKGDFEDLLDQIDELDRLRLNIEVGIDGLNLTNGKIGKTFSKANDMFDKTVKEYKNLQKMVNNIK